MITLFLRLEAYARSLDLLLLDIQFTTSTVRPSLYLPPVAPYPLYLNIVYHCRGRVFRSTLLIYPLYFTP